MGEGESAHTYQSKYNELWKHLVVFLIVKLCVECFCLFFVYSFLILSLSFCSPSVFFHFVWTRFSVFFLCYFVWINSRCQVDFSYFKLFSTKDIFCRAQKIIFISLSTSTSSSSSSWYIHIFCIIYNNCYSNFSFSLSTLSPCRSYYCSCFPGFSGSDCGVGPLCRDGDKDFCENGGICK